MRVRLHATAAFLLPMTEVRFIFNVPDKLPYAARVTRKLLRQQQAISVVARPEALLQLDQILWTLSPSDFIAHSLLSATGQEILATATAPSAAGQAAAAQPGETPALDASLSPVILLEHPAHSHHSQVLLNLRDDIPQDFGRFNLLYELVSQYDEAEKQAARERWRYYKQRGYVVAGHDLAQRSNA